LDWLLFLIEMVGLAFPGQREQKNEQDMSANLRIEAENRKTP
jgi:hypothetical protein